MGKWRTWLKGIISAAVSSVGGAVGLVIVKPTDFNLADPEATRRLLMVCGVMAIIAVANYLKQSPLPKE